MEKEKKRDGGHAEERRQIRYLSTATVDRWDNVLFQSCYHADRSEGKQVVVFLTVAPGVPARVFALLQNEHLTPQVHLLKAHIAETGQKGMKAKREMNVRGISLIFTLDCHKVRGWRNWVALWEMKFVCVSCFLWVCTMFHWRKVCVDTCKLDNTFHNGYVIGSKSLDESSSWGQRCLC